MFYRSRAFFHSQTPRNTSQSRQTYISEAAGHVHVSGERGRQFVCLQMSLSVDVHQSHQIAVQHWLRHVLRRQHVRHLGVSGPLEGPAGGGGTELYLTGAVG